MLKRFTKPMLAMLICFAMVMQFAPAMRANAADVSVSISNFNTWSSIITQAAGLTPPDKLLVTANSDLTVSNGTTITIPSNVILIVPNGTLIINNGGVVINNGTIQGNVRIGAGSTGGSLVNHGIIEGEIDKQGGNITCDNHNYVDVITLAATCVAAGSKTPTCKICAHTNAAIVIPALGHDWHGPWVETTAPTCVTDGVATRTCLNGCGETRTRTIRRLGHRWGAWVAEPPAGLDEEGTWVRRCVRNGCDAEQTRPIHRDRHDDWTLVVTAPDCIADGYTTYTCNICGYCYEDDVTDALGHDMGGWEVTTAPTRRTTGEERRYCLREGCDYYEALTIPATGGGGGGGGGGGNPPANPEGPQEVRTAQVTDMLKDTGNWYLEGYADGTMKPDSAITRAEVAVALYRLLTNEAKAQYKNETPFKDVSNAAWYGVAINTFAKLGVFLGEEDGNFYPDRPITRAEMTAILVRILGLKALSETMPFPDVEKDWAYNYILAASSNGLVQGYENGKFMPNSNITRAEFATMVNKAISRSIATGDVPDGYGFSDLVAKHWAYLDLIAASLKL